MTKTDFKHITEIDRLEDQPMSQVNSTGIKTPKVSWRLLPFLALGALVFAFNSSLELNYLVKGYITLLELQAGIVVLYFLLAKLRKSSHR